MNRLQIPELLIFHAFIPGSEYAKFIEPRGARYSGHPPRRAADALPTMTRQADSASTDAPSAVRLVLLAHGSKQPQWAAPFDSVLRMLAPLPPGVEAEIAYLESMHPLLAEALERAGRDGCRQLRIVPLFLGAGGHLGRDIPQQVAQAQARFPDLRIDVAAAAGESAEVAAALAAYARRCAGDLLGCADGGPPR